MMHQDPKPPRIKTAARSESSVTIPADQRSPIILISVMTLVFCLVYANSLYNSALTWSDPQYSHGYLVPVFALVLLWMRRKPFESPANWERWVGVGLITFGIVTRAICSHYVIMTVDNVSLIPCLLGIFTMVGGLRCLKWASPPIGFLIFMFPLPDLIVDSILRPLQTLATRASTVLLQTMGVEAYRVGNVIKLDQTDMGIIDQCSGLRMLTIFIAMSAAIAMIMTHRPNWERLMLLVSAIPIALIANVLRITAMGLGYHLNFEQEFVDTFLHEWAGLFMMPIALGLLFLEMQILAKLVIETSSTPAPVRIPSSQQTTSSSKRR